MLVKKPRSKKAEKDGKCTHTSEIKLSTYSLTPKLTSGSRVTTFLIASW